MLPGTFIIIFRGSHDEAPHTQRTAKTPFDDQAPVNDVRPNATTTYMLMRENQSIRVKRREFISEISAERTSIIRCVCDTSPLGCVGYMVDIQML